MEIFNLIIKELNKEEIRSYKLFSAKVSTSESRKDWQLFDYVRKAGVSYNEDKILEKLYAKEDKNSFYRLKNRLIEDVGKSILANSATEGSVGATYQLLFLENFFFTRNNYKVALYYLKKAEKKAIQQELFDMLDIIYGEYIKLSNEMLSVNPELFIQKRKDNLKNLNAIREIDNVLAVVGYRTKITQNFTSGNNNILALLEDISKEYGLNEKLKNSPKLRFRIYQVVSQALLQNHDYVRLEEYLITTFKQFTKERLFNKQNHDTKLQMLTYIVNALFKTKKLEASLEYAKRLHTGMLEYNNLLFNKYFFFYNNSLVINYSVLDKQKAISILEGLREHSLIKDVSYYEVFVYLNLAVLWFDLKEYHKAISNLNKFYNNDSYKKTAQSLKFKIAIAELIIRYELSDYEFLNYKADQVKKMYPDLLKQKEHKKEVEFFQIVREMSLSANLIKNKKLVDKIMHFLNVYPDSKSQGTEIISYNGWLNDKIDTLKV